MKIALCLIVKPTDEEAELLDRCLESVHNYVDGIFITQAGDKKNKNVTDVIKKYGGTESFFKWEKDFAKARNYNFAQVPKGFDYMMWCDADDVWRGVDKLRDTLEKNPNVDCFAFWYLYDFDADKQPIVAHKKTMVIKPEVAEWKGKLHEDLIPKRQVSIKFVEGIERLHLTTGDRVAEAQSRNVDISKQETKDTPNDPRAYWNYGNSLLSISEYDKAIKQFTLFLKKSKSDDEKYLAHIRLASAYISKGEPDKAIEQLQFAIGAKPDFPDAYLQLGYIYYEISRFDKAEEYLLLGLKIPPKYQSMIVFNPRDYDYNPMKLLIQVYFKQMRPDKAIPFIEACLKIYPDHKYLKEILPVMKKQKLVFEKVVKKAIEIEAEGDIKKIKKMLNALSNDVKSHPMICRIRNKHFTKEKSSGKDIVYVCYHTGHEWNPQLFKKKGFGGSEEAVVNLAKQWKKKGWNVTVYNNCGVKESVHDGVKYKPTWMYNPNDAQDITVLWRTPMLAGRNLNTVKLFVDMHDAIPEAEFTPERLNNIDKIFVKTNFHRSLYPNIPDEKFAIVPNGQDVPKLEIERDTKLIINTSSPDRSLDVLPSLFKKIKEQVPDAKCQWAYGWDIYEQAHASDTEKMKWMNDTKKEMAEAGIEELGRLPQSEVAKLYYKAGIFAYPTEFAEIDCISVKKAQASGAIPITTDFGALDESVQYGVKIHSNKTKDNWCRDYQFHFGMEENHKEFVDAVVNELNYPTIDRKEMMEWAKKFEWDVISDEWIKLF